MENGKIYTVKALCDILGCSEKVLRYRITRAKRFILNEKGVLIPLCDIEILKQCEIIFSREEEHITPELEDTSEIQ